MYVYVFVSVANWALCILAFCAPSGPSPAAAADGYQQKIHMLCPQIRHL